MPTCGGTVRLRPVELSDLPTFFRYESDEVARQMAAFTREKPGDEAAFLAHWNKVLRDGRALTRTIVSDMEVLGYVSVFDLLGQRSVAYWIGREYWGRGTATGALQQFLKEVDERPLYARVAKDNVASVRVLEKCGFVLRGQERSFAPARNAEIEELILELR